jgi:hypothetical protein
MIYGTTDDEKVTDARRAFEEAADYHRAWALDVEEDFEFAHSKQWDPDDEAALREQGRPVLTFNVIQAKIAHVVGALEDNSVEPVIVPHGTDDQFMADCLHHVYERVVEDSDLERVDGYVFEDGVIAGIGNIALDAYPDPAQPDLIKFECVRCHPQEILWDPASERRDKADARYVCWSRWMSRNEVRNAYPELSQSDIDEIYAVFAGDDLRSRGPAQDTTSNLLQSQGYRDGYTPRRSMLYFDQKRRQVRVVRMEYIVSVRKMALVAPDGRTREFDPKLKRQVRQDFPDAGFAEWWANEYRWIEFVGTKLLWEGKSPLPFDGFSIVPFVYKSDQDNLPYGLVRLLKDPQREVNKRYSQILHMIAGQSAPGLIAEQDTFVDEAVARREIKKVGGIVTVKSGALAQEKLRERAMPTFPEAIARLQEVSLKMLDIVSTVTADDMMEPRGIPEAAATTQLKHRRGLLSLRPILRDFAAYRRNVARRIIDGIVRAMPDHQIEAILGETNRFTVRGRIIQDQVAGKFADLSDLREVRFNIKFEPSDQNNTQRILEFQGLSVLLQQGIPVDPEVIFDLTSLSKAKKDRLKEYAKKIVGQQLQTQQQQLESAQQQLDREFQIDQQKVMADLMKVREQANSNATDAQLRQIDLWMKNQQVLLTLWERADSAEKKMLFDAMVQMVGIQDSERQRTHDAEQSHRDRMEKRDERRTSATKEA